MLGDLNVRLRETWDNREDKLATALAGSGLTDVTAQFTLRRQYRGMENWTWQMRREGRTVTGRGNSILSSDRNEFTKARVREARLHTDHQMVLAVLRGEGSWQKHRYVVGMTKCPLAAPTV